MRVFSILILLCFSLSITAQESFNEQVIDAQVTSVEPEWITNLDEAKQIAKKEKKPMLVYFTGSDWCTPCKKLKNDFFNTQEFVDASSEYVVVMLDLPYRDDIISMDAKKANKEAQKKLKVSAFPALLALDYRGKERNRIERYSYPDPHYYWEFMKKNARLFSL